jgi:hypothetical protein
VFGFLDKLLMVIEGKAASRTLARASGAWWMNYVLEMK